MRLDKLFGKYFSGDSWEFWVTFCKVLFNEPLSPEQKQIYERHTGRTELPQNLTRECWAICGGRRGGKSLVAALLCVFISTFRDHSKYLKGGERGIVMCMAADRSQAQIIFRYVLDFLQSIPMLKSMIESSTQESIRLTNNIVIRVVTSNFRTIRGSTVVAAVCDEIAFWRSDESSNPDYEVLRALRPSMLTVKDPLLLCISSPHSKKGALWSAYSQNYGRNDLSVMVWQASTLECNPTVDQSVIDAAYAEDPASASAEYGAMFRSDLESYVDVAQLQSLVIPDRRELSYQRIFKYFGFTDPSGGRNDSLAQAESACLVQSIPPQ